MIVETEPRLAYGIAEAAAMLGIGRTTIYELVRSGQLATLKIGQRRLVTRVDLERLIDSRRVVEARADGDD